MSRTLVVLAVVLWSAVAGAQTVTPTPVGTPTALELKPAVKTISVGEFANYTATLVYVNQARRNATQSVEYESSNAEVAEAPNTEGNRGRVDAVAPGVVTITATHTDTGLSASGELTVQGALVGITLKPLEKNAEVGDTVTYTASGLLSDGNTKNMTQKVVYSSSNTSVAVCPNADGNKSQVQVVGVGTTIISAVDPVTEIETGAEGSGTLTVSVPGATATGPTPASTPGPNVCGDPDDSGAVNVTDGVIVLSAAAGLETECTPATCDVNGNGSVSVTDGILVLRVAAGLAETLDCP
jgi:uncharacterized protein YjdB